MNKDRVIDKNAIFQKWEELDLGKCFQPSFNGDGLLDRTKLECLKDSYKSSIWRLEVTVHGKSFPVILKIMKKIGRAKSEIEVKMYRNMNSVLQHLMPQVYCIHSEPNHDWILMEHVEQIDGQVTFHPKYLLKIIPTLAKLHSYTINKWQEESYERWLPAYDSEVMIQKRHQIFDQTIKYLDEAMKQTDLKKLLEPSYSLLQTILQKGPDYFPEVREAGQCITHNDLQIINIGCNNVNEHDWRIKFLDWESAQINPCWYDIYSLIGVFFGYRQDFQSDEDQLVHKCVGLYAHEMNKMGVTFHRDAMELYKMAYLQRVLEYDLYLHLKKGLEKGKIVLLPIFLQKINVWGKELGLH